MNVNLGTNYPVDEDGEPVSFQSDIAEHQEIMKSAGFGIVGPAILIPEPGTDYPGSYQVWNPFVGDDNTYGWVYITPDGVATVMDYLPRAEDMENS